ncbi:hypothetical protein COY27_04350 [Candidatus Woesearchaeota archaeon CG_4_10_14_0_2_um_filter_33_13]|nr:MAG: hypothetical protein COY27_04350 [Candidatus Woesearchaeota archaeon CG_4_10_14_0_2_um_filter_33_13]
MDTFELKKEQSKLANKIIVKDLFDKIKTIGGAECIALGEKILAVVVVCEFPSLKMIEKKTYLLSSPLPYKPGYQAYREMPALMEAYNQLSEEPDILLVKGFGINHPRKFGMAAHLGLALNQPTIGVTQKNIVGKVEKGKIIFQNDIVGFEITTKEHANPVYVSPGHGVSLGSALDLVSKIILPPHKMPEPLHISHKIAKKKVNDKIKE